MKKITSFIKGPGGKILSGIIRSILCYIGYLGWMDLITFLVAEKGMEPLEVFFKVSIYVMVPLILIMIGLMAYIRVMSHKPFSIKYIAMSTIVSIITSYVALGLLVRFEEQEQLLISTLLCLTCAILLVRVMPEGSLKRLKEMAIREYKTLKQEKQIREERDNEANGH